MTGYRFTGHVYGDDYDVWTQQALDGLVGQQTRVTDGGTRPLAKALVVAAVADDDGGALITFEIQQEAREHTIRDLLVAASGTEPRELPAGDDWSIGPVVCPVGIGFTVADQRWRDATDEDRIRDLLNINLREVWPSSAPPKEKP